MSRLGMRDWTQGEIARLLDMRAEGKLTYTEMGMELGFTRNAIAAKLRRLEKPEETREYQNKRAKEGREPRRLNRRPPVEPRKESKQAEKKPKGLHHSRKAAYQIVLTAKTEFKHKPIELDEYERSRLPGASLIDVCGCRYPLTDSMPHMFCDAPRQMGRSYCTHHMAKTNPARAGTHSEKSAIKAAEWLVKHDLAGYIGV